jgi:hypothetical protein
MSEERLIITDHVIMNVQVKETIDGWNVAVEKLLSV